MFDSKWHFAVSLFSVVGFILAMGLPAAAQNYLTAAGSPTFTTAMPVKNGFINVANGNLHTEIPLAILPERGKQPYAASLVYDSRIWQVVGSVWEPDNIPSGTALDNPWAGWRFASTGMTGAENVNQKSIYCLDHLGNVIGERNIYSDFSWTAPDGTSHIFPITLYEYSGSGSLCTGTNVGSGSSYANDASGYYMSVANYSPEEVWAPDGTEVYPVVEDTNGNYYSTNSNGNIVDTLGRVPVTVTTKYNGNSNETLYAVLNSQGGTSNYIVTTESIPVHTAFGQSGVTEYSGNITVIASVQLPDGTSYQFTYDQGSTSGHYGELTGVTFPTGGSLSYGYTNFGGTNRWVNSYAEGSNTWTYSFTTTSSCPSGYSGGNQVTLQKPSGDKAIYTFCISNGAWKNQVQYESSSGTVLRTVADTWSNSNSNDYQELTETVTDPVPGGNIVRAKQFTYAGFQMPNITQISEWKYYTGTQPATPDRITAITYNTQSSYTNAHIINLPTEITVETGGGSAVADTKISYDGSSLASVIGVVNHDDTNYGTGNTVRGNPTQIQRLVSGSTYLSTSMTYDTTGQVRSVTDPKGNAISMSYANSFYNDNDATPPSSYSPSASTNAYLTQLTLPVIGTEYFGYYYGTGQLASSKVFV